MGIHAKIVQVILGHSSIAMLMNVYSHVLPTMQQNAMGMLGNAFTEYENEGNEPLE
jgi:integrase